MVSVRGLTCLALDPLAPSMTTVLLLLWLKPHWPLHVAEQASSCLRRGPVVAILPPLPLTLSIRKPNSLTPIKSVFVFTLVLEAFDYSTSNDRMVPILPSFLFKHYFFHSIDLCLKLHVFHWHVYCWPSALDSKLHKGKALYPQSHT